ncbi:MAG: hypothetical protein AAF657_28870, partial [Acidobacteriota bacterium]
LGAGSGTLGAAFGSFGVAFGSFGAVCGSMMLPPRIGLILAPTSRIDELCRPASTFVPAAPTTDPET